MTGPSLPRGATLGTEGQQRNLRLFLIIRVVLMRLCLSLKLLYTCSEIKQVGNLVRNQDC